MSIAKTKIKTATSKAGAAMSELVKMLQGVGADAGLSNEEFEKIFSFLHSTLDGLETLARHDRILAAAGHFDFDMEIAPARPKAGDTLRMPPRGAAPIELPLTSAYAGLPDEQIEWKKPTGRIAKTSPNTELAGQPVNIPIKSKTAPNTLDGFGVVGDETKKAGPVGFMDN